MEHESITILHYISLLQRHTKRYFDLVLEQSQIGSGQQYFLLRIYENDGINMQDLAKIGGFDKGTATRAVQKLHKQGYVDIKTDINDKRVRHIHVTDKARAMIEHIYTARDSWNHAITQDLSHETTDIILNGLEAMTTRSTSALQALIDDHEYHADASKQRKKDG